MKIGVDVGGTKIEAILLDRHGSLIHRERIPTEADQGYEHVMGQIAILYEKVKPPMDGEISIGVCLPGPIDMTTQKMKQGNIQCLIDKPIKKDLEEIMGHPVVIDNDANCFALAESILGSAAGRKVVFGVIMGTGVGGSICVSRGVYWGHHYLAGEWGHSFLHPGGNLCYCGKKGCVETYISGPALEKRYAEMTGEKKPLKEIAKNPPEEWKEEFMENFGMAISNIINILDPDIIVIGGGVSNIDFLYTDGPKYVVKYCFDKTFTPIVKNRLGDSAGVFGAALLT